MAATRLMQRVNLADGCYVLKRNNGDEEWYNADGNHHRVGGPAVCNAMKDSVGRWYFNGLPHCLTGPAICGDYYVAGFKATTEEAFNYAVEQYCKRNPDCPTVRHYLSAAGRLTKAAR